LIDHKKFNKKITRKNVDTTTNIDCIKTRNQRKNNKSKNAKTSSNQKILIEYHKQEIKEETTIANGRATKNID